jgi:hypothetical protein
MNIFIIFKEAFFIGLLTIIIGIIIKYFINLFFKENNYIFILILFITGFIIHIVFKISGINKFYYKYGVECKIQNSEKLNSEIIHPASL